MNYDSLIRKLAVDFEIPGVAVAIMNDFEFDEFTYGFSNIDSQEPITNKTLFNSSNALKKIEHLKISITQDCFKPISPHVLKTRRPSCNKQTKQLSIFSIS